MKDVGNKMQQLLLLGMLGIYSVEDLRKKAISVQYLPIFALIGGILHLYLQDITLRQVLFGILSGVGVVALSLMTRESIGMGDGILLIVTGIILGAVDNFLLICISLLYAAVFSLLVLVSGRCKRNQEIPFVPFLFVGYISIIIFGYF